MITILGPERGRGSCPVPHNALSDEDPGGAFESEDLPDPPGLGFIRPGNRGRPTRDDDLDLAALSEEENRSRIPAEQDARLAAKCWRGGNRCWCYGSTGRSCYGSPSGRSPVDC